MIRLRVILSALFIFISVALMATHIRAIEITAKRIGPNQYQFTVTGYRDSEPSSNAYFSDGRFNFGDGTVYPSQPGDNIPWVYVEDVGNDTEKYTFVLNHTYAGAGAYKVSYEESYRNANIINMSNSVGTNYFTETLLIIDPLVGINNTPILTVPPIDVAASGLIFIHNPGAFDEDGDSLSYRFSTPLQGRNLQVAGYRSLVDPAFYPDGFSSGNQAGDGSPTLTLDSVTGDLVWDAAGMEGEYNVAFIVEEWRKINGIYFRLGYVTRDMQILVEETDNNPPEVTIPEDLCVSAGTFIDDSVYEPDIIGTDPDGDPVTISAFGGPFEVFSQDRSAYYLPNPEVPQGPPGILQFFWQTDCEHIRERPYEIRIKIEDNPPPDATTAAPKLVDFETWNISIVGPAPEGLITTPRPGREIQLEWNDYACENAGATMQVWRRVGEFPFTPENCELGIPENAGYELIATLPITQNLFIDTNGGQGLAPGANYCYRLVAEFADPTGGTSYVSEEACSEVESIAPMITKVDVTSTSETTGTMRVEWIEPLDLDTDMFPGPYTYDVLRATGSTANATAFTTISTGLTNLFFDDTGLNTTDNAYSYIIRMYDNSLEPMDDSFPAASVRLALVPQVGAIRVNWGALVPWSNTSADFPLHDIYRDRVNPGDASELVLIATVDVTQNGFTFLDNGEHNDEPLDEDLIYCYYVTARGSYGNDDPAVPEPLVNRSQIQCAQPNDQEAPCTPIGFAFDEDYSCEKQLDETGDCDIDVFINRLEWEENMAPECDDDVVSFNLYFSATGAEGSYSLLTNTTATFFEHTGLTSFKGCYIIAAVDRSGNESPLSEPLCQENCIFDDGGNLGYKLPNVFTPNRDGVNDTFRAFGDNDPESCPRFVLSVDFKVIDRSGKELYSFSSRDSENDIYINWNGRTNNGRELPAGTYFYTAVVRFDTLDPKLAVQKLNGWVQIIR